MSRSNLSGLESFAATKVDDRFLSNGGFPNSNRRMSGKSTEWSSSLALAVLLAVGFGGFLGVLISVWNLSFLGSALIVVAFVEAIFILAGLFVFRHRRVSAEKHDLE